ncbi:MAG: hypothetical protein MUC68_07475 [Burkholderiaceae bacterium]|jgi:hypothetical protein|nr:hypothetical protein [Burkholderiaceae bacterium]
MPTRSLADALADSPAGPLLAKLAQLQRISQTLAPVVARLAPDFDANDPWACELKEGVLLLGARSAAQAAKLRQGVPGLLRLLHQTGAQVTEIRVRVQPARMSYPVQATDEAQVGTNDATRPVDRPMRSAPAVAGARALATQLAEGLPESPLQRAAMKLQASLRRRDGR